MDFQDTAEINHKLYNAIANAIEKVSDLPHLIKGSRI